LTLILIAQVLTPGLGFYFASVVAGLGAVALWIVAYRDPQNRAMPPPAVLFPVIGVAAARLWGAIRGGPNMVPVVVALVAVWATVALWQFPYARSIRRGLKRVGLVLVVVWATSTFVVDDPNCLINRNVLAGSLIPCAFAWLPELSRRKRRGLPGALVMVALLGTVSRGGILGGLIGLGWWSGHLLPALGLAAITTPGLAMLRNPRSLTIHLDMWTNGLGSWFQSPILGAGYGWGHYHNMIINTLAWSGLVGLATAVVSPVSLVRSARSANRWAIAALVALLAQGLVDDLTVYPLPMILAVATVVSAFTLEPGYRTAEPG
jgi:hypothetical protein